MRAVALRKTTGTFSWLERREQDCCRIRDSDEFTEEEGWAGRPPWRCGGWRQDSSREVSTFTTMLRFSILNNLKSESLTSDMLNGERRLHLVQFAARGKAKLVAFQHWEILFMTTSKIAT